MSPERTVLEHLLDSREALVLEVNRLTLAIEELDAVIGRVGGSNLQSGAQSDVTGAGARGTTVGRTSARAAKTQSPRTRKSTRRAPSKKQSPKSIRVSVLEMLAAEPRAFGLTEIIERIHAEGIRAHDDAVRSITVKLMKDGKVERVGRGQYRLAHGATPAEETASAPPASAPAAEPNAPSNPPPLNLGESWQPPAT